MVSTTRLLWLCVCDSSELGLARCHRRRMRPNCACRCVYVTAQVLLEKQKAEREPPCNVALVSRVSEVWSARMAMALPPLPLNATSGVTRLSFLGHRDATGAARRRLHLNDGWQLGGNLHTLGYFAADVCVGMPSKKFNLIVDTGSALMAMPCKGCKQCGHHKDGSQFDVGASSSGTAISCSNRPDYIRCNSCANNECSYAVSYAEGSRISGHMVQDNVHLSSDSGTAHVSVGFGCQTLETGLFNSQVSRALTTAREPQNAEPRRALSRTLP